MYQSPDKKTPNRSSISFNSTGGDFNNVRRYVHSDNPINAYVDYERYDLFYEFDLTQPADKTIERDIPERCSHVFIGQRIAEYFGEKNPEMIKHIKAVGGQDATNCLFPYIFQTHFV